MKKRSDRAQVHLFAVGMYQNHVVLDDCCGMPFCVETALVRHRFASNFDLFSAGSQVATVFVMSHTYRIEDFLFIRNYGATLRSLY